MIENPADNVIIFKCDHKINDDYIELKYNNSIISWAVKFKTGHFFNVNAALEVEEIKSKKWIHITATYNSNFGLANIYKNGRLLQSAYVEGSIIDQKMWIGGIYYIWKSGDFNSASGKLDELYIINSALGTTEIHDIMGVCNVGIDFDVPNKLKEITDNFSLTTSPPKTVLHKKSPPNTENCFRENILELNDSNTKLYYSLETYNSSTPQCYDSCCKSPECIGYIFQNSRCFRFYNKTENFGNIITCDINKNKKIGGFLEGPWNSIFISKSENFQECQENVCSKQKYHMIEYHENSKNCFGSFCDNQNECSIIQDSAKNINLLFTNKKLENNFKILSKIEKTESTNLTNKCDSDYSVEAAKPSQILLDNFLIRILNDSSIENCINVCCEVDSCDIIYVVDRICWLITCPGKKCKTYKLDDKTKSDKIITLKRKSLKKSKLKNTEKYLKNSKISKCRPKIFKHGYVDPLESFFDIIDVKTSLNYRKCNENCCDIEECNIAFFKKKKCYLLRYLKPIHNMKKDIKKTHEETFTSVFEEKPKFKGIFNFQNRFYFFKNNIIVNHI